MVDKFGLHYLLWLLITQLSGFHILQSTFPALSLIQMHFNYESILFFSLNSKQIVLLQLVIAITGNMWYSKSHCGMLSHCYKGN